MNEKATTTETGSEEAGGAKPADESEPRLHVVKGGEEPGPEYRRWPPPLDFATIVVAVLFILMVVIALTRIH